MAQPALFVFGQDGNSTYEWRHAPSASNLGGAVHRPSSIDILTFLKGISLPFLAY
jgi:hypothetical protein